MDNLVSSSVLSTVVSILLSLLVELVPAFARKWDKVDDVKKRAIRGWVGLAVAALAVLYMQLTGKASVDVSTVKGVLMLLSSVVPAWVSFVLGGQTTFETSYKMLPRKRNK